STMSADPRADYDAIAAELTSSSPAERGVMFGMPCLKRSGRMFAGFYRDAMVFKLGEPQHGEALALSGARPFDPSGRGRRMKEWFEVPPEHASRWPELADHALRYIAESV